MTKLAKRIVLTAGVLALTGSAACSAQIPEAGDYVVYRVAAGAATLSQGCFAAGIPGNIKDDTSTIRTNGTFLLYPGQDGTDDYYLDIGSLTMDGTYEGLSEDGEEFEFVATTRDVTYSCSDGSGDKFTSTAETKVKMAADGPLVTGKITTETSFACEGAGCAPVPPTCSVEVEFVGTEIPEVQLHHDIGDGNSSPVPDPIAGQTGDVEPPIGTGGNCAPTCNHSECDEGGPLAASCNACTNLICTNFNPSCCEEGGTGWNSSCVNLAANNCGNADGTHCG